MTDTPSFVLYVGDGATTAFVFPFSYLAAGHVEVTVNGVARGYTLASQNTVNITPAPANLADIRIARHTPGPPLVTWNDGAVILGRNLNTSSTQPRYIAEEARDVAAEAKEIAQTSISGAVEAAAAAEASAVEALASQTAAASSKTAAASSATSAASSATTGSNAASTATTKASEAAASATVATTKAGEASASASTATTKASEASTSATTANMKAGEASASAGTATTKAGEASTSATQAAASASSAAATRTLVEGIYDSFDDRYLGLKTTDPTVDNDGAALVNGAIYFNTTLQSLRLFTTSGWQSAYIPSDGSVASFNNRTGSVVPVSGDYDVAKITGLQTALDGKAPTTHDHAGQSIVPNTLRFTSVLNLGSGTDLDTVLVGGFYDVPSAVNKPNGSSNWGYLQVNVHSNGPNFAMQLWTDLDVAPAKVWVRTRGSSVWAAWQAITTRATVAEVRSAAVGNLAITTEHITAAANLVQLTDAAGIAVPWNTFINAYVDLAGNRTLLNPTNQQVGTWRTIMVRGADQTPRTLLFDGSYLGEVPVITDATNTKNYLVSIYCFQPGFFVASAKRALG